MRHIKDLGQSHGLGSGDWDLPGALPRRGLGTSVAGKCGHDQVGRVVPCGDGRIRGTFRLGFEQPPVQPTIISLIPEVRVGLNLLALGLFYVGPETLLPLTSVLGAIGGLIMIFWRQVSGAFRRVVALFNRRR